MYKLVCTEVHLKYFVFNCNLVFKYTQNKMRMLQVDLEMLDSALLVL